MANLEVGTLYDCKNQTKSYDFLQTARVHALLLSISFKPIFVDFTLLIDMLALLQFSFATVSAFIFFYFRYATNTMKFFIVFGLTKIPLLSFRPLLL